jgi:hypothetical protein
MRHGPIILAASIEEAAVKMASLMDAPRMLHDMQVAAITWYHVVMEDAMLAIHQSL